MKIRYQEEKDATYQESIRQDYETLESFIQQLAAAQSKHLIFKCI
jgi:ribosomal protein S17E